MDCNSLNKARVCACIFRLFHYLKTGKPILTHRIHEGKLHTPLECEEALDFVAKFIDRLDLIDISQKEIEEFRKKSKAVE